MDQHSESASSLQDDRDYPTQLRREGTHVSDGGKIIESDILWFKDLTVSTDHYSPLSTPTSHLMGLSEEAEVWSPAIFQIITPRYRDVIVSNSRKLGEVPAQTYMYSTY